MTATVAPADSIGAVSALEIGHTAMLVASALAITWFAAFVVYRLYRGQR